jgi:cation diffusion facilitator CzcD-associated flavoprotein CzcO
LLDCIIFDELYSSQVDFIPTHIKRITATGIETIDGQHQDLDAIVCATGKCRFFPQIYGALKHSLSFLGFDTTFQLPFPFIGRAGVSLQDVYTPHPTTYLSICVPGFPNWFQALGPNSAVGSGSLLVVIERQIEYAIKATLKLQRERLKSIEVTKEATRDFDEYIQVRRFYTV